MGQLSGRVSGHAGAVEDTTLACELSVVWICPLLVGGAEQKQGSFPHTPRVGKMSMMSRWHALYAMGVFLLPISTQK